jgi:uncharacterized protein YjbI with pentapeptide repeats
MANDEHLAVFRRGVKEWNLWRAQNPETVPDLTEAELNGVRAANINLAGARLDGISLEFSDLRKANLIRSVMRGARLEGANLAAAALCKGDFWAGQFVLTNFADADFSDANLGLGVFNQATLDGANLRGAALGWAVFRETSYDGADFDKTSMQETVFANVDLSCAKNLDRVQHHGPSTVGIDVVFPFKRDSCVIPTRVWRARKSDRLHSITNQFGRRHPILLLFYFIQLQG